MIIKVKEKKMSRLPLPPLQGVVFNLGNIFVVVVLLFCYVHNAWDSLRILSFHTRKSVETMLGCVGIKNNTNILDTYVHF